MDNFLKEDVIEKFKKRSDSSYVVISIGDLRELLPILDKIEEEDKENKNKTIDKKCVDDKTKLISLPDYKKLVPDGNEIIPIPVLERRLLVAALIKTGGDIDKTAEELGVSKRTVYRMIVPLKVDKYGYKESQNS